MSHRPLVNSVPQHVAVWRALADYSRRTGAETFTASEIAVAAWIYDRGRFGLEGYEADHPDSHTLASVIHGAKGMVKRGFLVKVKADDGSYPGGNGKKRPRYVLGVNPEQGAATVEVQRRQAVLDAADRAEEERRAERIAEIKAAADRVRAKERGRPEAGRPIHPAEARRVAATADCRIVTGIIQRAPGKGSSA